MPKRAHCFAGSDLSLNEASRTLGGVNAIMLTWTEVYVPCYQVHVSLTSQVQWFWG